MGKLGKLLKKAMVISMEDQISYCNKTIQVGPHVLVVTSATVDTTGETLAALMRRDEGWPGSEGRFEFLYIPSRMVEFVRTRGVARKRYGL